MTTTFRIFTNLGILVGMAMMLIFAYGAYYDPQVLNAIHCQLTTDSDLAYAACRIVQRY